MKTYSLNQIIKFSDFYNVSNKVIVIRNIWTDEYFLTNLSTNNISKRFDSNIIRKILKSLYKVSKEDFYKKFDVIYLNQL